MTVISPPVPPMGLSQALQTASPLLLGAAQGIRAGRPNIGIQQGLAGMLAQDDRKKSEAMEVQANEAIAKMNIDPAKRALLQSMPASMRMQAAWSLMNQKPVAGPQPTQAQISQQYLARMMAGDDGGAQPAPQGLSMGQEFSNVQPQTPLAFSLGQEMPQQPGMPMEAPAQPLSFGAMPPQAAPQQVPQGGANPELQRLVSLYRTVSRDRNAPPGAKAQIMEEIKQVQFLNELNAPPTGPDPTAAMLGRDEQVQEYQDLYNVDVGTATAMADGLLRPVPDGLGGVTIVDMRDVIGGGAGGQPPAVPGGAPTDGATPAAETSGVGALPTTGVDYAGALGLSGDIKSVVNTVGDYLMGARVFEEVGKGRTGLQNLRTRTLTTLATAGVAGRPSNYVMEMFNQNVVQPGLLSGPAGARDTAQQTLDFIKAMEAENRAVLQSRVDRTMKAQAARNIEALAGLAKDYETVLGGMQGGGGSSEDIDLMNELLSQ